MQTTFNAAPLGRGSDTHTRFIIRLLAILAMLVTPVFTLAAGVSVRLDFSSPATSPFPSDRFTQVDWTQNTFRRVKLPKPDCVVQASDCADIDVINTLDGFNTQPRITVPFNGDIDLSTVTSETVYLVNLGDTLSGRGFGHRVGINQIAWDSAGKTLVFESDELLNQHSRYVLVVTNGVHDAAGDSIEAGQFAGMRQEQNITEALDHELMQYRKSLMDHETSVLPIRHRIVALSLFTTQSVSADLEKIHRQIKRSNPASTDFMIANGGTARAVFSLADLTSVEFVRQTGAAPAFTHSFLPTPALNLIPGAIGRVAFGKFSSPDYQNAAKVIPATGTLTGHPVAQSTNELVFELFLPSGPRPANGWPVAIFGHGFTDSMYGAPWTVASVFAAKGIATIAINVVGHGGGAAGTLNVNFAGGAPVVVPAGGRGIDQDGNGAIDSTEGVNAIAPQTIISSRDGLRQTVVDLMQLVRQIQVGIDVDGNGSADLDKNRIYYAGQSFGGIYGTIFLGVEGSVKAGVPNVPGGSITEVVRLGAFRVLSAIALATRQPQLLNLATTPGVPVPFNLNFNENIPLRDQPPLVNSVPGSTAIQQVLDRNEWVQQAGNPVSYASFIRKQPLRGNAPKPVIVQFAKGDGTVPNPTTSALLRAGDLADRAMFFRNDLAFAAAAGIPKNPHTFLTNIGNPIAAPYAIAAQQQIATFFASDGTLVIDPDEASPFFEMPITLPLPEALNFLP
jgi:Bacterial virulence factor lipase N-terminal